VPKEENVRKLVRLLKQKNSPKKSKRPLKKETLPKILLRIQMKRKKKRNKNSEWKSKIMIIKIFSDK
jgi:hypothetical protein